MVTKWHQPESKAGDGNESGTAKKMPCLGSDYAFINSGSISPMFCQILKRSVVTKWHQPEFMVGQTKESGTAKRCHLCDLILLFSILGQFHPAPIFVQILKSSMMTKLHQPESKARNGNESGTAKKMSCLRSDHVIFNFGSISPIFGQILKCSMVTKWHQSESISGYANESGTAKKSQLYATSIFTFLSTRLLKSMC